MPHCQGLVATSVPAGIGSPRRLTDHRGEGTTWKGVLRPSVSSSSLAAEFTIHARLPAPLGVGCLHRSKEVRMGSTLNGTRGDGQLPRECGHHSVPEVPDPATCGERAHDGSP